MKNRGVVFLGGVLKRISAYQQISCYHFFCISPPTPPFLFWHSPPIFSCSYPPNFPLHCSGLCSREKFKTKMEDLLFQNETSSKHWLMHIQPLLTVAEIRLNITCVNVTQELTKRWLNYLCLFAFYTNLNAASQAMWRNLLLNQLQLMVSSCMWKLT